jgi:hypothetical protein
MASVDVEVHIPKLGMPDFSWTARQLGQRSRPGNARPGDRPSDVWELVRLVEGKVSLDRQRVEQIHGCNFVKDLFIRIDFGLEYFVARDLQDGINKAEEAGDKALENFYRSLLLRIRSHAHQHYEQFVKVIMAWEGDIKDDLVKTLPTKHKPTSLPELDIKQAIGTLVSDWALQLEFRLKQRAFDWEKEDYPEIEADMRKNLGASTFMPMGLRLPPKPKSPASPRKVTFPRCPTKVKETKPPR